MARLFTLTFSFEQKQFDAEIMVDDATENSTISVYVGDKSLHQLLPGGKAVLRAEEMEKKTATEVTPAERLKSAILQAFKEHENQSPPVNMW